LAPKTPGRKTGVKSPKSRLSKGIHEEINPMVGLNLGLTRGNTTESKLDDVEPIGGNSRQKRDKYLSSFSRGRRWGNTPYRGEGHAPY